MKSYCKALVFLCLIFINVISMNSLYADQTENDLMDETSSKNEQNNDNSASAEVDSETTSSMSSEDTIVTDNSALDNSAEDSHEGEYLAYKYLCTHGSKIRKIQVKYLSNPAKVPCRVLYYKENNAAVKILWRYNHQEGYCETHAEDFVEKQRGWGWSCSLEDDKEE